MQSSLEKILKARGIRMPSRFACCSLVWVFATVSMNPVAAAATDSVGVEAAQPRAARADASLDPFIAGALGVIPFSSGLYLSERPARGVMFTAIDVLAVLGVYTSKYTVAGNPNNTRNYFLIIAANNVLDACLSSRYALRSGRPQALVLPMPDGGFLGTLAWRF